MSRLIWPLMIAVSQVGGPQERATPRQPDPFRVQVTLVPVDVLVVDRKGRPAGGLGASDFEIFEDGVRQEIVYLAEGHGSTPEQAQSLARQFGVAEESLRTQPGRTFLIYLGRGRHGNNFHAVGHLADFVEEKLRPQDRVAVMAYNRSSEFSNDHPRIARILRAYEKVNLDIESRLDGTFRGLAGIYRGLQLPAPVQARIDAIFEGEAVTAVPVPGNGRLTDSAGDAAARTASMISRIDTLDEITAGGEFQGVSGAADADATAPLPPSPFDRMLRESITDLPFDQYMEATARLRFDVGNMWSAIDFLQSMDGEKHLIAITEGGWNLGRQPGDGRTEAPEETLARLASHGRVRLHVIDTAGVDAVFRSNQHIPSAEFRGTRPRRSVRSMRSGTIHRPFSWMSTGRMAHLTGGRSYRYQYANHALDSILKASEAYYLLGYVPSSGPGSGFRKIEVRLKRRGLQALHRGGYYAETARQLADRKKARIQQLTLAVAEQTQDLSGLALSPRQVEPAAAGEEGIDVALGVAVKPEAFALATDRYQGRLEVLYVVFSREREMQATVWDTIEMSLLPNTYFQVMRSGIRIRKRLPAAKGAEAVKVVVMDRSSNRIGSLTLPLNPY